MSRALKPKELVAGMRVTAWSHSDDSRSGMGEIFPIITVDLPYVVVERVLYSDKTWRHMMDTRMTTFGTVGPAICAALDIPCGPAPRHIPSWRERALSCWTWVASLPGVCGRLCRRAWRAVWVVLT